MDIQLKDFLEIPYTELERLNLESKKRRIENFGKDKEKLKEYYIQYLQKETRIKAVTVSFTDLEGKFHMLDYDKDYILESNDNLTFDGSSVKGFTHTSESDLRLKLDWSAFYWLPSDIFGPGKVMVFAEVYTSDNKPHPSDFRSRLREYTRQLYEKEKYLIIAANEIEGVLVEGLDAEINFDEEQGFKLASSGGYYHSLPLDKLRVFIDSTAEAHRALGFENEKDHPEVAPSQFELNYKPSLVEIAADQVQLYKLAAKQVAEIQGMTATFLPKPLVGVNGNGMHTNISIEKEGKNIFYNKNGEVHLSSLGTDFIDRILNKARAISLVLNPSVNAYRRLDPKFEAPNQIKASAVNRSAMIRIPLANEKSSRIEVRSVSPDVNPYMIYYTLLKVGLEGPKQKITKEITPRTKLLPDNIYDAIKDFRRSNLTTDIFGQETKEKSSRIEVRSVSPDVNPYMVYYTLLRIGLEGPRQRISKGITPRTKLLPDNIYDAIKDFRRSNLTTEIFGQETKEKYIQLKQASADRCPKSLGSKVKRSEVIFHHEVTNQLLWNEF